MRPSVSFLGDKCNKLKSGPSKFWSWQTLEIEWIFGNPLKHLSPIWVDSSVTDLETRTLETQSYVGLAHTRNLGLNWISSVSLNQFMSLWAFLILRVRKVTLGTIWIASSHFWFTFVTLRGVCVLQNWCFFWKSKQPLTPPSSSQFLDSSLRFFRENL